MNILKRIRSIFQHSRRNRLPSTVRKGTIECCVKLLDGNRISVYLPRTALTCELCNQVLIQLDLVERDFFGLCYKDPVNTEYWVDPLKSLGYHLKRMASPYLFEFRVKFYAIDPDELNEELTRYQFFLQLKSDVIHKRLMLNEAVMIELAALSIQSEVGDYEAGIAADEYIKEALLDKTMGDDCVRKIESRYKELAGLNPGQCEIRFLSKIKQHEFYGIQRYLVRGENGQTFNLGFTPSGIMMIRDLQKVGFYSWNRVNIIGFKNKSVKILIHNRLDPNIIDKYTFWCVSAKIAKSIWKSAIEHHSFFRLIRVNKSQIHNQNMSRVFTSNFRYSGRTFYEASENTARTSRKKMSFKRSKTMNATQRTTAGYIRLGSRVFGRAENGEYFRGQVVALSDKVYVQCDDGITLAHHKNTTDGIIYDANPDYNEIKIGTRVIARWPGISNYLPGNVSSIDGTPPSTRYLVSFDDGDNYWNNLDQIRLLKPPMYFGPGSNCTYLQKKFSMIKTTTLVNTKLSCTTKSNNTTFTIDSLQADVSASDKIPATKPRIKQPDYFIDSLSTKFTQLTAEAENMKPKTVLTSKI